MIPSDYVSSALLMPSFLNFEFKVHNVNHGEPLKLFTSNELLVDTPRPDIKFEHVPHNFCNQQHQQSGAKVRAMTLIVQDRADYTSRLTYSQIGLNI